MKHFNGRKIKEARRERSWSVSDLHFHLAEGGTRISMQSLRNWENGKAVPSADSLAAVKDVLRKDFEYFFT